MSVVQRLRRSQFLRHNLVFLGGSLAVGALHYAYYPVLGRSLSPAAFGEAQTLVTLFLQLSVFLSVLSMVIVNVVTNDENAARRNELVFEFEKLALGVTIMLAILSIAFQAHLQRWLHFTSPWPFVILALAVVASVPFVLRGAYLRGRQRFGLVAAGNLLAAGGKLVIAMALVALGWGVMGAIGGVLAAQLLACGAVGWWAYRSGLQRPADASSRRVRLNFALLAPELRYASVVLVASLAITLQYSLDVIVIKHYFDAHTAGLYAGVAAVARIVFFATASIAQVLLSKVKRADPRGSQLALYKSLAFLGVVCLPILIALVGFPAQTTQLLMGSAYVPLAALLPKLSIAIFIISIVNLLVIYYLALRRTGIAIVASAGALLTFFLILWHHGSPAAIVDNLLLGSVVSLIVAGVWSITERRHGV